MSSVEIPVEIRTAYGDRLRGQITFLAGAGGFSGAQFWRVENEVGRFCLRRWPREHPTPERLRFQHEVLRHAQTNSIEFVPVPVQTVHGQTWVAAGGHLWELTPWMPGKADFHPKKRTEKLIAAMKSLARLHASVSEFSVVKTPAIAPSASERAKLWERMSSDVSRLNSALQTHIADEQFATLGRGILAGFTSAHHIEQDLRRAAVLPTPLQPVIRDIHDEHVLFEGDEVSGIVDFGALRIDSIAVDISRLLGSMAEDDELSWDAGLAAYKSVNPIQYEVRALVPIFDRSAVVLSGMNWLRWILLEGRTFEDFDRVLTRLCVTHRRLRHLIQQNG